MEETRIIDPEQVYQAALPALPEGSELNGGKFAVKQQIGSGGFGITYLAGDNYLERDVVIKECFPEAYCTRFGAGIQVSSPRFEAHHRHAVDMFMREARSIAKLRHPNIVSVHQVFEENDTAYMVLDLIKGRDLADIIEDDGDILTAGQVHEILIKLLDAIDLIHQHDLLHRDISPDNILIDKWGSPALIDFGAAREDASQKVNEVSKMLVVKDGYSPHEFYVSGGVQGPSSDLYALAASFYHLISGIAPPDSQTRVGALTAQQDDPCQPLAGRFPQYGDAFLKAIDKAMSLAPNDRFQSATAWRAAIEQDGPALRVVPMPTSKTHSTKTISELVEETNKQVMAAKPEAPKAQQQPQPETKKSSAPVFSPEWIDEFNRETMEKAARQREATAAEEAAKAAAVAEEARQLAEAAEEHAAKSAGALSEPDRSKSRSLLDWVRSKPV